mgnify:CR=1 FL=1
MESLRMCIACREMKDKRQLVRIVKNKDNEIFIDSTGKKNGRGAYICKNETCISKMQKQKLLNKTFKTNVSDEIYSQIKEQILDAK